MIPFTPTQEELPRLLDGSQTLIVRAVEVPEANAAVLGRDYTYPDVIKWSDQIATRMVYPRKGHWCGLVDTGNGWRGWTYDIESPLGAPGDVVFCQEEWAYGVVTINGVDYDGAYLYRQAFSNMLLDWQPAESMEEKKSRLLLRIISVDCRRVQAVTEEEALAAGFSPCSMAGGRLKAIAREMLIASLDDDDTNPWVWLVQIERCERP